MNTWVFSSYYFENMLMCIRPLFYSKTTPKLSVAILNLEENLDFNSKQRQWVEQKECTGCRIGHT